MKGSDVILEGKQGPGRRLGIKEMSQISKRYMPEIAIGKPGSKPQVNSRIDHWRDGFKALIKERSSRQEPAWFLRGRKAILDSVSFDEFTKMLYNFFHAMLLDRKEKCEPVTCPDRLSYGTRDGEPAPVVLYLQPFIQPNKKFTNSPCTYTA